MLLFLIDSQTQQVIDKSYPKHAETWPLLSLWSILSPLGDSVHFAADSSKSISDAQEHEAGERPQSPFWRESTTGQ